MDKQLNGHVTMNVYLVFDKIKLVDRNSRYVNVRIDLDDYIYQFDKDLWSVSDVHAQAERDLDKYLDALITYTKNVIEHMFDSCTFDVTKTSYTSNVFVTPDGIARIFADTDLGFCGVNPRLQKNELNTEIEKQIQVSHGVDLAGIDDTLIHVNTFINVH